MSANTGRRILRSLYTPGTAGTVQASKVVVVDANKDLTGIRNLTITGTLVAPTQAETDATFTIVDDGDATKVAKFQCSGITTATTRTFTFPDVNDTLVTLAATQTLTNKTLTAPTINGAINTNTVRTSAPVTKNNSSTYANVTGLSATVVPGTYAFKLILPSTVASGTGGIKYCFNYTTTVVSALESTSRGFTASAVAVQHTTTTTTQTDLFTQAAVVLFTEIEGTMVVSTGGTIDVQMAQNTANGSDTVALLGGYATFNRIA